MQQEDLERKDDATTRASKSDDRSMKHEEAKRLAEELVAEEAQKNPRSAVKTYLIALIIGLIIWAAVYFLWVSI